MKKIIVSVTSDLATDQRVDKVCRSLQGFGFEVFLAGRKMKHSLPVDKRPYQTKRMLLFFERGFFFYAEYNIRLFFLLLSRRTDILLANDLDTLPANYIVSKIKSIDLVYDSHEYFTGAASLTNRPLIRSIWKVIEKFIFPSLRNVYTVNLSIAGIYEHEYGVNVKVIRNVPYKMNYGVIKSRSELGLPERVKIVILQGAHIDEDRGAEEAVRAIQHVHHAILIIIGSGLIIKDLKNLVADNGWTAKVVFKDKMPFAELYDYTCNADIALAIDKDKHLNYRYSLPNKLFDYIHAGTPVLASPLPEIKKIFTKYDIGEMIETHEPVHIAAKITSMLSDEKRIAKWKSELLKAADEYCWDKEEEKLRDIYKGLL